MADIRIYRFRKYKKWQNAPYEELLKLRQEELAGIDVTKGEEMVESRKGAKTVSFSESIDKKKKDRNTPDKIRGLDVREFIHEAASNPLIIGLIDQNKTEISFIRNLYSMTTLTAKEIAFLFTEELTTIRYYFKRFAIKKFPKDQLTRIEKYEHLATFLQQPLFELQGPNLDETSEELLARYNKIGFQIYNEGSKMLNIGDFDKETVEALSKLTSVFSTNLKLEMEAKKMLNAEKEIARKLREKEIAKNEKTSTVINFNGDIGSHAIISAMKESLIAHGIKQESEIEKILIDVTKSIEEVSDDTEMEFLT